MRRFRQITRAASRRICAGIVWYAAVAVSSCGYVIATLELENVQFFQAQETRQGDTLKLRISGLAMHSSLAIGRISATEKGDTMNITVALVPARKGLSGNMDYEVEIPPHINAINFGTRKAKIWQRNNGNIKEEHLK